MALDSDAVVLAGCMTSRWNSSPPQLVALNEPAIRGMPLKEGNVIFFP